MSITDELRRYISGPAKSGISHICEKAIANIADRIDAEHEAALLNVHTDLMDASGWVRLPKDADGEYIHIGDRMENNERVARIVLTDDSWEPSVYLEKFPNVLHEYFCNEISHYQPPTVEDVLREMADRIYADEDEPRDRDAIVAEYAQRLQLREVDA